MSAKEREEVINVEENSSGKVDSNALAESMRILEALLFASEELLTANKIKSIIPDNPDIRKIRKMVEKINAQLQKERHPFEIVEIGGGYQFRTVSYYHPWVRQIFKEKAAKKLSIQALECLAIIAYKQPISKAEIEAVRGVVSDGAMKTLLERRLITVAGRSEKPGRPLLYGTTHDFLKYFGLNKIEDLPKIEEFEAIAREKVEELSIEELQKENDEDSNQDSETDNTVNEENTEEDSFQEEKDSEETSKTECLDDEEKNVRDSNQNIKENKQIPEKTESQVQQKESTETDSDSGDKSAKEETATEAPLNESSNSDGEAEAENLPGPESTAVFEVDFGDAAEENNISDNAQEETQKSAWDTQEFDEKIREMEDGSESFIPRGSEEIVDEQEVSGQKIEAENDSVNELESSDEDEYMEETAEINKETIRMDTLSEKIIQKKNEDDVEEEEEEVLEVFFEPQDSVSDSEPQDEDDSSKKNK